MEKTTPKRYKEGPNSRANGSNLSVANGTMAADNPNDSMLIERDFDPENTLKETMPSKNKPNFQDGTIKHVDINTGTLDKEHEAIFGQTNMIINSSIEGETTEEICISHPSSHG